MLKPDYKNCILNITNSLLKYYGDKPFHSTLPVLDAILTKQYKNIVLLVMDGMGTNVLERNLPENSFLRKNIVAEISSVFPPTTTAATTSILTGKTPAEHGWIGWSCYFKEVDKCIDLFTNRESGTAQPASEEHMPYKQMPYDTIVEILAGKVKTCAVSPFTEYYANTIKDVCKQIKSLCDENGRTFIYAYHAEPDHAMHDFGVSPSYVTSMLEMFNQQLESLAGSLSNTLFLISADHGMTDITMKCVEEYPQIHHALIRHICVEPRCCSLYVKNEYLAEFPEMFSHAFGDKFILLTHDEFLQSGLLGDGDMHQKVEDFVGDYVAIAVSDIALWYKDANGEYNAFKGAHAGLTSEELSVPLIVIERP